MKLKWYKLLTVNQKIVGSNPITPALLGSSSTADIGSNSTFKSMSYLSKLISNNTGVSSKNFFLVAVTLIGLILLLVPAVLLIIEVCYNHTIQTDLNGLAAYIGAVAGVFASAGITKAWSEKYEKK